MAELAQPIVRLIDEISKLPGIGRKSAERLTYYLLRISKDEALKLSDAIRDVKLNVHYCKNCFNLSEEEICPICQDPNRDSSQICVVEQPQDLIALEQTGAFHGVYHVLLGRLSPLEKTGPEDLTINALVKRIRILQQNLTSTEKKPIEIILGTNPTVEGDGTSAYIINILSKENVAISRLARGITLGSMLEFTNKEVLTDAITERRIVQ